MEISNRHYMLGCACGMASRKGKMSPITADEVRSIFREALTTSFGAPVTEHDWEELAVAFSKRVHPHYLYTKLAEKDDQIHALEASRNELVQLRVKYQDVLKEKDVALHRLDNEQTATRNYMHSELAVKKQLADVLSQVETLDGCVAERDEKIRVLEAELAKLKPPEPKFRVGQVVHARTGKSAGKILRREYNVKSMQPSEGWFYWLENYSSWWYEGNLRALTDEEK